MKLLNTCILFSLFSFFLFSCDKKNDLNAIHPSSTSIESEAEGGQQKISFANGNWKIIKVINRNNNGNIFGNIYSANGELLQENHILQLDSLGKLKALWSNKGFSIERKTQTSIKVHLNENFTRKEFGFIILLESDSVLKRINITQKPSQGYKIKNIQYTLETNDGDSIFYGRGETYYFDINTSTTQQKFSFNPFINAIEISCFKSQEYGAFPWKGGDSALVKVPTKIENNKVLTNDEKSSYYNGYTTKNSKFINIETPKIDIQQGESNCTIEIEYQRRRVTYTMHLVNNKRT